MKDKAYGITPKGSLQIKETWKEGSQKTKDRKQHKPNLVVVPTLSQKKVTSMKLLRNAFLSHPWKILIKIHKYSI